MQAVHPPPSPLSKQPQDHERKQSEQNGLREDLQQPACFGSLDVEGAAATGMQDDSKKQQTQPDGSPGLLTRRIDVPVIRVSPVDEPQAIMVIILAGQRRLHDKVVLDPNGGGGEGVYVTGVMDKIN